MQLFLKPLKAEIQLLSADQIAENSHAIMNSPLMS